MKWLNTLVFKVSAHKADNLRAVKLNRKMLNIFLDICQLGFFRKMLLIRHLVHEAISTGYLTIEAEEQLRQMLTKKYDQEDMKAFMNLQLAAMSGNVKQQSRELLNYYN